MGWCIFFFQAEDGIRDGHVTGVQTCALPIYVERAVGKVDDVQEPEYDRKAQAQHGVEHAIVQPEHTLSENRMKHCPGPTCSVSTRDRHCRPEGCRPRRPEWC